MTPFSSKVSMVSIVSTLFGAADVDSWDEAVAAVDIGALVEVPAEN